MLIGAHCVFSSTNPRADLAFFRDVLKLPAVDDGGLTLPGGGKLSVYQPRHQRPTTVRTAGKRKERTERKTRR